MTEFSRRKLITTGLAAAAGVSGLAVGARLAAALWTNSARWRWRVRSGRDAYLRGAADPDSSLVGSRVRA